MRRVMCGGVLPVLLMATTAVAQERSGPYPVAWRGVPFREAVAELTASLGVPAVLDGSVDPSDLDRRVRLTANHLTAQQAIRWLARSVDLEAVEVDGVYMVGRCDRIPIVWQARQGKGDRGGGETGRAIWERIRQRTAEVAWVDSPLSGVARDTSDRFNVDLVFHPDLHAEQPAVSFEGQEVSLASVLSALEEQLGARSDFVDGCVWLRPRSMADLPVFPSATRDPGTAPAPAQESAEAASAGIRLTGQCGTWRELAVRLGGAGEGAVRLDAASEAVVGPPPIEAVGTLREILEGLKLLGLVEYDADWGRPAETRELLLRPAGRGSER